MKKFYIITGVIAAFCLIGYLFKYTNVAEYATAMQKVREKNSAYKIEAIVKGFEKDDTYVRMLIKGDKWKAETSKDGGKTYEKSKRIYDGNHVYEYQGNSALIMDFGNMFKGISDYIPISKMQNPLYLIYDWHLDLDNPTVSNCRMWKFAGIKIKKGHICRRIKYYDRMDACISDKYGISLSSKIASDTKKIQIEVKKISVGDYISDSEFELPPGTKVSTFEDFVYGIRSRYSNRI